MRTAWVAGAVAAVLAAGGGAGYYVYDRTQGQADRAARDVVRALAAGWSRRDVSAVPFADQTAKASFRTQLGGLQATRAEVRAADVRRDGDTASAALDVTWTLAGDVRWSYRMPVSANRSGEHWVIAKPAQGSLWHPDLAAGATLTAARVQPTRGDLLDRSGTALMPLGTVYPVQLDPTRATPAVAAALEQLVEAKPGSLVAKLAAAQKAGTKAPIGVITYREADFQARRTALDALVGVLYPRTQQPLADNREFAQPLLGAYGEVSAEIVKAGGGRYRAGDRAGISGLQRTYDAVLAGTPGVKVTASTGQVLFEQPAVDGTDVQLTLDPRVQRAAEAVLAATGAVPSALVAIDVPSGGVLAAANHPWFGFDRALTGQYPPGSTFKVASTYALLQGSKVALTDRVSCPKTFVVDGRPFRNFEGETLGSPTFLDDVTHSCNTAFVQLAARLGNGDLNAAATALGIGAGWARSFGASGVFEGSVPQNTGQTDQAAATIGQGRNLVSPLALATMIASVARGSYLPPALVTRPEPEGLDRTPVALDVKAVADLRTALRSVVTKGTGTALASAPGGPVFGKTGTAEFGGGTPPKTHAWFVGVQGNVAFAVLVEQGRSGGSVAAPIAKQFLTALR